MRAERVLPAGRRAVDADARDVVPRILRGDRLVPENAVGKPGVAQVLPRDVVERLRAIRRAHAVHLHDDEAQLGEVAHAVRDAERTSARTNPAARRRCSRSPDTSSSDRSSSGGRSRPRCRSRRRAPWRRTLRADASRPRSAPRCRRAPPPSRRCPVADALRTSSTGASVDARPGVDDSTCCRRTTRLRASRLSVGERREAGAVEVDSVVVEEVRILLSDPCRSP